MAMLTAAPDDQGRRLDRVLRKALPELPLSLIHRLLREGRVLVDGRRRGGDFRVAAGQAISLPAGIGEGRAAEGRITGGPAKGVLPWPGGGALRIIYEDADFLVLNKEAGLPVHGGGGSLEALARAHLSPRLPPSLSFRPGPLHRLDKPTSGIVVFSASLEGARRFSALLREGKIRKQYLALVEGSLTEPGIWEDPLLRDRETRKTAPAAEGKTARTRFSPLAPHPAGAGGRAGPGGRDYSLLVMEPETGRTHQIRAHAAAHGHPLGGDAKYGGKPLPSALLPAAIMPTVVAAASPGPPAFLLHAWKLLPLGNAGGLPPLEAPPPDYFLAAVEKIFGRGIISRQRLD